LGILNNIKKYNSLKNTDNENIKLKLMASHPFIFLRGTVEIFFKELSKPEYQNSILFDNSLSCWCANDIHITNFGFSNISCSTNKEVHYQINDFDEAFLGNPFNDIIRLCSSLYYFIEEANIEISKKNKNLFKNYNPEDFINIFIEEYKKTIKNPKRYRKMLKEEFPFMYSKQMEAKEKSISTNKNSRFSKYVEKNKNGFILNKKNKKLKEIPLEKRIKIIKDLKKIYPNNEILDLKERKVAGVGSSHLERYYFIMKKEGEYLLMELKEQIQPVSTLYIKKDTKEYETKYKDRPIADIQIKAINKMIGKKYDENLSSLYINGKSFISRTSFNAKLKVSIEELTSEDLEITKSNIKEYIKLAAIKIGKVHVRSAKEKYLFQEKIINLIEKDSELLKGMIKRVYNEIEMSYSSFLREYYLTLGNEISKEDFEEIMKNTFLIINEQSGKLKKEISKTKNKEG